MRFISSCLIDYELEKRKKSTLSIYIERNHLTRLNYFSSLQLSFRRIQQEKRQAFYCDSKIVEKKKTKLNRVNFYLSKTKNDEHLSKKKLIILSLRLCWISYFVDINWRSERMTMRRDYQSISRRNVSIEWKISKIENIFQQASTFSSRNVSIEWKISKIENIFQQTSTL
jgi:hypothetical protein